MSWHQVAFILLFTSPFTVLINYLLHISVSVAHRFPIYATEGMLTIGSKLALEVLASNEQ